MQNMLKQRHLTPNHVFKFLLYFFSLVSSYFHRAGGMSPTKQCKYNLTLLSVLKCPSGKMSLLVLS